MAGEKTMITTGEGVAGRAPALFSSVGLGSCVVVTLYDTKRRIGGLAHIMLPGNRRRSMIPLSADSFLGESADAENYDTLNEVYYYADTAIAALLKEMMNKGASLPDIVAKIAGGAKMFADGERYEKSVGGRNVKSIKQLLKKVLIPVVSEDTGGSHGRNVDFYLDSGRVIIGTIGGMDKEI